MAIYRISSPSPVARVIFSTDASLLIFSSARWQLALPGSYQGSGWDISQGGNDSASMCWLIEMTGKEQPGGRKEGLAGVWAARGAAGQCFPVGRGQTQGTGFLVNSVASSKNTRPRQGTLSSSGLLRSLPRGLGPFPERSRGWEESLVKSRISLARKVWIFFFF